MAITAVIPLKGLASAKGRLSEALDPMGRRSLVAWMATRVITACQACDSIDDVLVVAGDEDAAAVARWAGADVLVVPEPGLDVALARADATTADLAATLVVAADLPQVSVADLEAVVAAAGSGPVVIVAPTDDGGTGALLRRPPTIIPTAYGPGSAAAHERLAREAGVAVAVVHRAGLAADVDTPNQLPAALALAAQDDVGCRAR